MHRPDREVRRPRLGGLIVLAAIVASMLAPAAATAAEPPVQGSLSEGSRASGTGTRGPVDVSALPALPAVPTVAPAALDLPSPFHGMSAGTPDTADPTADTTATTGPTNVVTTTAPPAKQPGWAGMGYADTGLQRADPSVAAGPDHIVQVVNASVKMWERSGKVLKGPTEIAVASLFDLPPGFGNAQPRILFDALQGRWVMSELSWTCESWADDIGPSGFVDFLVSRTADPTGIWDSYFVYYEGFLPDHPAFGTSTDKLAAGSSVYALGEGPSCTTGASYVGTSILVMDWADVLTPADGFEFKDLIFGTGDEQLAFFSPRIALQAPATSSTLFVIAQHQFGTDVDPYFARIRGSVEKGTVGIPYQADLTWQVFVIDKMVDPPPPVQPGGSVVTHEIDSRPTDLIWQANRLTWVSSHGCLPTGDDTVRSCVRISQVTAPAEAGTDPTLVQDFVVGKSGQDHYRGSIAQALDGTLYLVWTRSFDGPGGYPTSVGGYQRRGEPGKLSAPEVLGQATGGAFEGGSWGDVVGIAQDPQVPNAVWQGNLFSSGGQAWSTAVSQLQTGGSTYVPITPIRVLDSRVAVGLSGAFKANEPRDFVVAGFAGPAGTIPPGAIAVTGNLTVTRQTSGGYVSVTPTKTSSPRSSTINFPTGDTRANNATVSLSTAGRLAAVYKASTGKTAHILFDVTGYFLPGPEDAAYNTLTPTRFLDTRSTFNIGLTGRFSSGVPRKLDIAGVKGVPGDAVAITANLTVVGQSAPGYVAVTTTSQATPATSTLNFPRGDVRANGLTAKLGGGDIWLVYKSASGAKTDLIVDVTGYYRAAGAGMVFYALEPGRIMDTRMNVLTGLKGMFTSGTPRRLDTDGHWGVPVGAKAVTGNLTVTGQTAGGYVAITPTSQTAPTTSSINFPLGDTRANGVTVPLHTDGNQYLVFKSGSARKTHLILDVTGYFK